MKHRRYLCFVLLCVLLIHTLTSCIRIRPITADPPGTETEPAPVTDPPEIPETEAPETDPPAPEPEPEPEPEPPALPEVTLEKLREANRMETLLGKHSAVLLSSENGEHLYFRCFWTKDGETVSFDHYEPNYEGDTSLGTGLYKGFDYTVRADGSVNGYCWVYPDGAEKPVRNSTAITEYLPEEIEGEIAVSEGENGTLVLKMNAVLDIGMDYTAPYDWTVTADRETFEILALERAFEFGGERRSESFTAAYDGEKQGEDVLAAWDDTREIVLEIKTEAGEKTEKIAFPAAWKLALLTAPVAPVVLSCAEGTRSEYGDYTFEPGKTALTLEVYDEANAPVLTGPETLHGFPFTAQELTDRNRISKLLDEFGTVVSVTKGDSYVDTSSWFKLGGSVVDYIVTEFEDAEAVKWRNAYGTLDGEYYEVGPDGKTSLRAEIPYYADPDMVMEYEPDAALTAFLVQGNMKDGVRDGDVIRFRVEYPYDPEGNEACEVTVDSAAYRLLSVETPGTKIVKTVEAGADIPVPAEFSSFPGNSRKIVCHYGGEAGDRTYTIPADWTFMLGFYEDITCFSDTAMTAECGREFPGGGGDLELWIRQNDAPEPPKDPQTTPAPIGDYVGNWYTPTADKDLQIREDGSFLCMEAFDTYEGTLRWTEEDKGSFARGPRYELVQKDGNVVSGNAYVTLSDGMLTLARGGGAELFWKDSVVRGCYESELTEPLTDFLDFTAESGEYAQRVVLRPDAPVKDFSFCSLKFEGFDAMNNPYYTLTELYKLAEMKPDKPLVVEMTFGEAFPFYGFTFRGGNGLLYSYGIMQSGMDGSVEIVEIRLG